MDRPRHHDARLTAQMANGNPGTAAALLPALLALAGVNSPLIFPKSIAAQETQRRSAVDGRPVVFWRPGCPYCMRLRSPEGRATRAGTASYQAFRAAVPGSRRPRAEDCAAQCARRWQRSVGRLGAERLEQVRHQAPGRRTVTWQCGDQTAAGQQGYGKVGGMEVGPQRASRPSPADQGHEVPLGLFP